MNLNERLKAYEGTLQYQQMKKYYRNGKFYPYPDSLGKMTIGYGHLIMPDENFSTGITETQADALLDKDIAKAIAQVQKLGLNVPEDWQAFLIIMTFQLGLAGVRKFRKMIDALRVKDYPEAIRQAKNSLWYRQTPNRVNTMVAELKNK